MKIIDSHTHIASSDFIPTEFMEGVVDNMMEQMHLSPIVLTRAKLMDRVLQGYQDHDASRQLREMNRLGIRQAVVLLPDFTYALGGNALTVEEMYQRHHQLLLQHGERFVVFAGVDPRWGADGFRLFVKGIEEYGFRGLKLYPPCGFQADSPLLTPYYEYCEAHHLPVLIHIGATSPALSFAEAMPIHVDGPARRYRNISFILAHGAVNYQEQCLQLCKYRPNVYLDLSGAQRCDMSGDKHSELGRLLTSGIGHKILFGTDWPINGQANMNSSLIAMFNQEQQAGLQLSRHEAQLILAGNIERILAKARFANTAASSSAVAH